MIIEKKKVLDNRVVFWMWLKMDFKDFSNFISYSHFKKTCLSVIKQDEQILDNVVKYLCSSEQQDYLSKLNVLWDCFPAAQKRILDTETGKLNLRFNCLSSKIFFGQSTMRQQVLKPDLAWCEEIKIKMSLNRGLPGIKLMDF